MITYRDVYLTVDGYAREEDGYEFRWRANKRSKLVCGVGVNDFPKSCGSSARGDWKPYALWKSMLRRVHSPKELAHRPTYLGVEIDESWYSLNNLLNWFLDQPYHSGDFQIEKDIIGRGKFYGPDDCLMVPQWVNCLITDSGASRGDLPTGVRRHGKGFEGQVQIGTGRQIVKHFKTVSEASAFYHRTKQEYVDSKKEELDYIDSRLYSNICRILKERRPA